MESTLQNPVLAVAMATPNAEGRSSTGLSPRCFACRSRLHRLGATATAAGGPDVHAPRLSRNYFRVELSWAKFSGRNIAAGAGAGSAQERYTAGFAITLSSAYSSPTSQVLGDGPGVCGSGQRATKRAWKRCHTSSGAVYEVNGPRVKRKRAEWIVGAGLSPTAASSARERPTRALSALNSQTPAIQSGNELPSLQGHARIDRRSLELHRAIGRKAASSSGTHGNRPRQSGALERIGGPLAALLGCMARDSQAAVARDRRPAGTGQRAWRRRCGRRRHFQESWNPPSVGRSTRYSNRNGPASRDPRAIGAHHSSRWNHRVMISDVVVIGSQAILGSFPNAPGEFLVSNEADVYPLRSTSRKDIRSDSTIGEGSPFQREDLVTTSTVSITRPRSFRKVGADLAGSGHRRGIPASCAGGGRSARHGVFEIRRRAREGPGVHSGSWPPASDGRPARFSCNALAVTALDPAVRELVSRRIDRDFPA